MLQRSRIEAKMPEFCTFAPMSKKKQDITQKAAIVKALEERGGRARLIDIYSRAIELATFKPGSDKQATIRTTIQRHPELFRHSPGKPNGWWELTSYQEEIANLKQVINAKDEELSSLKAKVELLEKRQTVEDFVKKLVKVTKQLFKIHRNHADFIRQVLEFLGFTKDAEDLAAWIEHKENRLANAVEKIADKPAVQVDVKAGAIAQITEQGVTNQHSQLPNK